MKKALAVKLAMVFALALSTSVMAQETQPSLSDQAVQNVEPPAPVADNVVMQGTPMGVAGCSSCGGTAVMSGCNTCGSCNSCCNTSRRRIFARRSNCCSPCNTGCNTCGTSYASCGTCNSGCNTGCSSCGVAMSGCGSCNTGCSSCGMQTVSNCTNCSMTSNVAQVTYQEPIAEAPATVIEAPMVQSDCCGTTTSCDPCCNNGRQGLFARARARRAARRCCY